MDLRKTGEEVGSHTADVMNISKVQQTDIDAISISMRFRFLASVIEMDTLGLLDLPINSNKQFSMIIGPRHTPNPLRLSPQTPCKKAFFWGVCTIKYFLNLGDTNVIQNMKNIKSQFPIDL